MAAGDAIKEYWRSRYKGQVHLELLDEWNSLYGGYEKVHGPSYQRMLAMEAAKLTYAWRAERLADSAYNLAKGNEKLLKEILVEIKKLQARQYSWHEFVKRFLVIIVVIFGVLALGCVAWIFVF